MQDDWYVNQEAVGNLIKIAPRVRIGRFQLTSS